ncbi:hypothetical protein EGR_04772 [Echinococcus granulosus]|uniref:Uncharacterized protein n=1 Tax=Echinococcus granulosus TaxID=6210 RepID=W6UFY4_ECHGR|nr:hypothetical protein EGR_04772 [Echinococcus granulosus]EUB60390.1 hypothetical protein EGR_04772 [Echinococcus granulosus]
MTVGDELRLPTILLVMTSGCCTESYVNEQAIDTKLAHTSQKTLNVNISGEDVAPKNKFQRTLVGPFPYQVPCQIYALIQHFTDAYSISWGTQVQKDLKAQNLAHNYKNFSF